ncbi:methyl-accepting chemotaxis protein [Rhodoferax aquaticus]|uniref:HAMP domain-containing protein n=1 Tax=Rhodoferax aquaticus TaxID=2527691 RepID=A0A515ERP1_9BURK|nr:methyl-accepting chemotaxis protein [Rhodoferax aquaticus]QDL55283.1 HAMP domain-containing protein [Rhodoferax aquaticus]
MSFQRLTISTKLWLFIGLVVGFICAVAIVGLSRSNAILAEGRAKQDQALQMVQLSTEWTGLTETNSARNMAIVMSPGNVISDVFSDAVTATSARITDLQKQMEAMPLRDADQAQLSKIKDLRKTVIETRDAARKIKTEGNEAEAQKLMRETYQPALNAYVGAQRELVKMQQEHVAEVQVETEARRSSNAMGIIAGLIVIIVVIFVATRWLVGSIREPLEQANALAARIAQGDLSTTVTTSREDEFGNLLRSLHTMNQALRSMVTEVRGSTDSIATASAEIAAGNNDLAQRTEQTSSNLQSTASSMGSLTSTVQQSADNARQASALASSASTVAVRGGAVVQQVVQTMQEIDASSKKIADIISVIDGIAFQTNILALNAAVEAARAGEQGRGFAVVASEVRTLAQRSADAAKEIKALINTSVEKVESGTALVTDAGTTMDEIVQSVRRVADVISEITAAANAQSSGIEGVNQSVGNLDQMTQQNAALVEESAAAAESLRDQADRLKQAVAVFNVGSGSAAYSSGGNRATASGTGGAKSHAVVAPAARAPVRSSTPKPAAFKGPERRLLAPKPGVASKPQGASAASAPPKTQSKPAPAGGDDDWETF